MTAAERYLARAEEMMKLAEAAPTPDVRQQYEEMARGWQALATHQTRTETRAAERGRPPTK